jgi:hypothetical protein
VLRNRGRGRRVGARLGLVSTPAPGDGAAVGGRAVVRELDAEAILVEEGLDGIDVGLGGGVRRRQVRSRGEQAGLDLGRCRSLGRRRINRLGPFPRQRLAFGGAAGKVEMDSLGEEEGANENGHGGLAAATWAGTSTYNVAKLGSARPRLLDKIRR